MAEIQMIPTWPSRVEAPSEGPPPVDGDPGFALAPVAALPSWPSGAGVAAAPVAAVAGDPLARWLDGMLGMTADFAPSPVDPAPAVPAATLPQAEGGLPLSHEAQHMAEGVAADPQTSEGPDIVAMTEMPADSAPTGPGASPVVPGSGAESRSGLGGSPLPQPGPGRAAPLSGPAGPQGPVAAPVGDPVPDAGAPAEAEPLVAIAVRVGSKGPSGAPCPNPAAGRDGAAPRPPETEFAGPAPIDAVRRFTAGMSRTGTSSPEAREATLAADPAPSSREASLSARVALVAPSGEAMPNPEIRLADAMRPTTATGGPGPQADHDPRPVIRQVTDALVTTRGDRTEIALSPEELGRIRLVMSGPDRSQITLWAERPETLDLIRRNADLLTQQLTEAGVNAGSLEFRRDERGPAPTAPLSDPADESETPSAAPALRVSLAPAPLSDRRIDIRL